MDRWRGKTALVTGGSTGIGLATVKALLRHEINTVTCSRHPEKSDELQALRPSDKVRLVIIKCDAGKEEQVANMFEQIEREFGHVDILVNSAGGATKDDFISGEPENWRQMIDSNFLSAAFCTKEAIRLMRRNNIDGHIININSVSGHELITTMPVQSTAKHGITVMTEAVNRELKQLKSSIKMTSLSPGPTDTPAFRKFKELSKVPTMTADEVVDCLVYILSTPPHVLITELTAEPIKRR